MVSVAHAGQTDNRVIDDPGETFHRCALFGPAWLFFIAQPDPKTGSHFSGLRSVILYRAA